MSLLLGPMTCKVHLPDHQRGLRPLQEAFEPVCLQPVNLDLVSWSFAGTSGPDSQGELLRRHFCLEVPSLAGIRKQSVTESKLLTKHLSTYQVEL